MTSIIRLLFLLLPLSMASANEVVIFAAASLQSAIDDLNTTFALQHGPAKGVYAPSSVLARQIEQGAEADVFISANVEWMDYLESRQLLADNTRVDLLRNELVLVSPTTRPITLALDAQTDLAAVLNGERLVIGDPSHVPFGMYAKQSFEHLGLWSQLTDQLAYAENVRVALSLVARNEAPLGVVYRSDTTVEPNVQIAAVFPPESHSPIVYPAAQVKTSRHPHAAAYLQLMRSAEAAPIFQKYGFLPLN